MRVVVITVAASLLVGCAGFVSAPVVPPVGLLYTDYNGIIDTDADSTTIGSKVGRADVSNILGLISTGDASVAAAAKAGGITTIRHIDYEFFNLLGIFSRYTTVVHGD